MGGRNQAGRGASSGITLSEAILRNQLNPRDPVDTPIFIDTDHRSLLGRKLRLNVQLGRAEWILRRTGRCV